MALFQHAITHQDHKDQLSRMHKKLHKWYKDHGRHYLPWRQTTDPYHIYLSETMLQQTQVATVLDRFYFPFLNRFPTLASLASAPLEDVLKCWEGLGYYTRARNLHKAAGLTSPQLPTTVEALQALPGIGKNTAHAVAAFAYHQPVAIMEANVKRIVTRVFAYSNPSDKELWEAATSLLDTEHPFDYNQAMMDIGATICTKTNPSCLLCPLSDICEGKTNPQDYPAPKQKKITPTRHKSLIIFENKGYYFTVRRESRFLHGLYGFIEQEKDLTAINWEGSTYFLQQARSLGHITQTYSHFTLDADVYLVPITSAVNPEHGQWETLDSLKALPLSKADLKIITLLSHLK